MNLMVVNPGRRGLGDYGGLTDILTDVQKLGTGAAIAIGGALIMGVGTVIPGKFGWGFKLLGVAGMGVGAYKIYQTLSNTTETDEQRADREEASKEQDVAAATTGKGSFGMLYHEAMDILASYRSSGELWAAQAKVLKAWMNEVGSEWKSAVLKELKEAKAALKATGNMTMWDTLAFMFI